MRIERHATAIRIGLAYMAVAMGVVAVSILLAPRGFYDGFPGPESWVAALPPYNEHLLRDFGSAGLGLAILAGLAAWWLDRRLVQATAIVLFVGNLPHAVYHATETGALSLAGNLGTVGGLFLQALLPLGILYLATGPRQQPAPTAAGAGGAEAPGR